MQILDYVELTASPAAKILLCVLLAIAILAVYYWEPGKSRKRKENEEGSSRNVEVDPKEYTRQAKKMLLTKSTTPVSERSQTLNELERYVDTLKRNHINNIDEV